MRKTICLDESLVYAAEKAKGVDNWSAYLRTLILADLAEGKYNDQRFWMGLFNRACVELREKGFDIHFKIRRIPT